MLILQFFQFYFIFFRFCFYVINDELQELDGRRGVSVLFMQRILCESIFCEIDTTIISALIMEWAGMMK